MITRTVFYHGNCADGYTAAWATWKKFGDKDTVYIPVTYGDEPLDQKVVRDQEVYFVDFSYKPDVIEAYAEAAKFVHIYDHHKTHAEALVERFRGHRNVFTVIDIERSGAGVTWDVLHGPSTRPWIVNYVEDRDLWKFELNRSKQVNAWLGVQPRNSFEHWSRIAAMPVSECILLGTAVEMSTTQYVSDMASQARQVTWEGHDVFVVNAPHIHASELVGHLAQKAAFAVGWFQRGDGQYQYSLRSRNDFDVSEIAKKYGGGGHKNAAGFTVRDRIPGL